jgi:hypothetical protein
MIKREKVDQGVILRIPSDCTPGLRWAYVRHLQQLSPAERHIELDMLCRVLHAELGVDITRWFVKSVPPEWIRD